MQLLYTIKNKANEIIGKLPSNQMLNGASDIGDIMNSWIVYTNYCISALPQHPLAVMNTVAGAMVQQILSSAATFEISTVEQDEEFEHEGIITWKGKEYYVVESTPDAEFRSFTLEVFNRKLYDLEIAAATRDDSTTDNLDAIWTAVQAQWARGAHPQAAPVTGPVVAAPARHKVPDPDGHAQTQEVLADVGNGYKVPVSMGFVSQATKPVSDVAAAQQALRDLLAKGRL